MVLKDTNGLVKLFALVNVEDYSSIVAIGETQQQAMNDYKKLLAEKGILSGGVTADMKEITILSITQTVIDGNTVFFYETKNTDGQTEYYRIAISEDESAIFIKVGDTIKVNSINSATDGIYIITEWEYLS
jgi:D-alanine-D-alanine ligase-like ATP-grasp enzyme